MHQLVDKISCEISDPASPNTVCYVGSLWLSNETLHIDSLRDSNMCPTNLDKRIMNWVVLLFIIGNLTKFLDTDLSKHLTLDHARN